MSVINTNYLALVSQNNLNKSQNALGSAIERLSSGLRINSAKDDAAGQAIANRFTANIKGLTQAARNANDGISLAQTTEGALNEINNNLQRIRELTVQAANGTNSASDLKSIQAEIAQRRDEINRVSAQTDFNGVKVLAKEQSLSVQVGAHDAEQISVGLKEITTKTLGLDTLDVSGLRVSKAFDKVGFELKAADSNATPPTAAVKADANTKVNLADGYDLFEYAETAADGTVTTKYYAVQADGKAFEATVAANSTGTEIDVTVSTTAVDAVQFAPLAAIDTALQNVDTLRSDLGAIQNRFQSAVANLNNTVNNLSAARSRIEDADYAVEVSNMTRAQILQQAGTSVLAQANQVPQTVLSLLR